MTKAYAIIDTGFGDSGKGKTVDWLSRKIESKYTIRFNGGSQAAHNVVLDDGYAHTFSQFGSGTFNGAKTYLSKYVSVEPLGLLAEARSLANKIDNPLDMMYINKDCKIITPFHRLINRFKETRRNRKHGSCGIGYGECILLNKMSPNLTLHYSDLVNIKKIRAILDEQHRYLMNSYEDIILNSLEYLHIMEDLEDIIKTYASMYNDTHTVSYALEQVILENENNIFEGAQGILLDETYGFNPYTTYSTTNATNIYELYANYDIDFDLEVIGVLRTFPTRHGAGPFPSEIDDNSLIDDDDNRTNKWQDHLRVGLMDFSLLKYAQSVCHFDSFVLTHFDKLDEAEHIAVLFNYGDIKLTEVSKYTHSFALTHMLNNLKESDKNYISYKKDDIIEVLENLLKIPCMMVSNGKTNKDVLNLTEKKMEKLETLDKKTLKRMTLSPVTRFMSKKMAFTSVDICNFLRSEYKSAYIKHESVANILRKSVINYSHKYTHMYECTLIGIELEDGTKTKTYLYHHENFDPASYLSRDQTTIKTVQE